MKTTSRFRKHTVWWVVIGLLGVVTALASVVYPLLQNDIADVPETERRALYERTLETLRVSCADAAKPAFVNYCRQQADFIRRFPECNVECREVADHFATGPSR